MTRTAADKIHSQPVVAIVDDEMDVRRGLDRLIRSLDMETRLYASAEEVLDNADRLSAVVCLVSDVEMPRMNGLELQRELQARNHRFPVIFVTAYPDEVLRTRAMEQGAFAFFGKPFDTDEFVAALDRAVGREPTRP